MNPETQSGIETATLAADAAGEPVGAARKRLAAAQERAKVLAANVREKAAAGVKAADETVPEHPHQAMVAGVGLGVLAGYLLGRRFSRGCD